MDTIQEVWLPVVGYEGYQVSNLGNIKRKDGKGFLSPSPNVRGYLAVALHRNASRKTITIHKLVAFAFLGERPEGYEINHKDGNKVNNDVTNLEYVTARQNKTHAKLMGLYVKHEGEKNGNAKLTVADVLKVRELLKTHRQKEVAVMYGVKRSTIGSISTGKSWKHLE